MQGGKMNLKIRLMQDEDLEQVLAVYKRAFAGLPWHEDLSDEEVLRRWEEAFSLPGFRCFVAIDEDTDKLVGAHWMSFARLEAERGTNLWLWVHRQMERMSQFGCLIIWERELVVDPKFSRQGIGTLLRKSFLKEKQKMAIPNLILTRLREDNIGSIKPAEQLGFQKTGIQKPASEEPFMHDYWYLLVNC